jgi:hypothetical protein
MFGWLAGFAKKTRSLFSAVGASKGVLVEKWHDQIVT